MRLLELFSGTCSIGKVAKELGYEVHSVDKFMESDGSSDKHHLIDIYDFDYKQYPRDHFDVVTASPVCTWWSLCRKSNFGKILKNICPNEPFTWEHYYKDIEQYGIPMVDKTLEILDYFKPQRWWIENPATSDMKYYINDLLPYVEVHYCQYGFGYPKKTRFWVSENIKENFKPKLCHKNCIERINKNGKHRIAMNKIGSGTRRELRYRIPNQLVKELLTC
tara:strand:+ start:29 stop:691 length:663 start_codon:yes stop_codon:yes gene_type:complete